MKEVPEKLNEIVDAVLSYRPESKCKKEGFMAFDHKHYVPILKGKQGEFAALANITSKEQIARFTPLIEIPPIPLTYYPGQEHGVTAKTIDEHIVGCAANFADAVKHLPSVFVDGIYVESEDDLQDSSSPIDAVFAVLREKGIPFVPVIGLDRVEDYADSVSIAMSQDGRGCCLRLFEADMDAISTTLAAQISGLIKAISVEPNQVDLLIDYGPKVPQKGALPLLINALPFLDSWRTVTLASSSFPPDMGEVARNSVKQMEREEWTAWNSVRVNPTVKRIPAYGDYGINHPVLTEYNPLTMSMSPNIRYTDLSEYVIAKGQAQPRKKWAEGDPAKEKIRAQLAPSVQYPKLAATIKAHAAWKGKPFSWGDAFIDKCSHKECGNATVWRAVGMNHHIALAVQQIASLP